MNIAEGSVHASLTLYIQLLFGKNTFVGQTQLYTFRRLEQWKRVFISIIIDRK